MKNFFDFTKAILPGWFFNGGYVEKLLKTNILPIDVTLQVLDYIPRMRDLTYVAKQDYKHHEYEKNLPQYVGETNYEIRAHKAMDTWIEAGSRPQIYETLTDIGYILDSTNHDYGIQDGYENWDGYQYLLGEDGYSIWSGSDDGTEQTEHKQVVWGHFIWGGYIDIWAIWAVYIYDPNGGDPANEYTPEQLQNIQKVADKFGPAHTILLRIFITDGFGNITKAYKVDPQRVITLMT